MLLQVVATEPKRPNVVPKVYAAGKTTGTERGLRRGDLAVVSESVDNFARTTKRYKDAFVYVGPYAVRCDHQCVHSEVRCAAVAGQPHYGGCWEDLSVKARTPVDTCRQQIESADLALARTGGNDLYGTLAEVATAQTLQKRTALDADPELTSELWFTVELTLRCPPTVSGFGAVRDFLKFLPRRFQSPPGYTDYLRFTVVDRQVERRTTTKARRCIGCRHFDAADPFDCSGDYRHFG